MLWPHFCHGASSIRNEGDHRVAEPLTRYMTLPTELMGVSQLRMAMAWQRKERVEGVVSPFLRDSPGFEIVPELAPTGAEPISASSRS
jgi:hypothetical protein